MIITTKMVISWDFHGDFMGFSWDSNDKNGDFMGLNHGIINDYNDNPMVIFIGLNHGIKCDNAMAMFMGISIYFPWD